MADYIFNIYLHTDRGEFSEDYSLSEYSFNLPSFYFALNEYVSAKAVINILNSSFSCTGAAIYNATAYLRGASTQTCEMDKTTSYTPTVNIVMNSKALAIINTNKYSAIRNELYMQLHAIGHFDYA